MKFKLLLAVLAAGATVAQGTLISVHSGGITLVDGITNTSTTGADALTAWRFGEIMTSAGTLQFEGTASTPLGGENTTGSGHEEGRWFQKKVQNNTGVAWTSFELELQVILGTPSGQGDGLSFADVSVNGIETTFFSDVFTSYTRSDITRDYLNFSNGVVLPGEFVNFYFVITDQQGNDPFFLLQTPNRVDVPEPGTMALMGFGLISVALLKRRKNN